MSVALAKASEAASEPNVLTKMAVGDSQDYTRLAFTFKNPLETFVVRRDDVERVVVDLGPATLAQKMQTPANDLISGVEFRESEGQLTAIIHLTATRYELRHFLSRDKYSAVLDFKKLESTENQALEDENLRPLVLPTLAEVAEQVSHLMPPKADGSQADNLFQRFLAQIKQESNQAAKADGELFLEKFPTHPGREYVSFLLPELIFFSGNPTDTYAEATAQWKSALENWPKSALSTRARFMLAESDRLTGLLNEAAGGFKIVADDALLTDYVYPKLAVLRAADILMELGMIDEARSTLEPIIKEGVADRLGLEAYVRVGMADFYQGFFSQANEVFREALRLAPQIYQTIPAMLYAAGEGYHYLDRPDLSRLFLMHALNLMPDHPKADVMMARIGDNYRKEGYDREAMAIYGAAKRQFPDRDGGVISQVRLAEMGALHSFFSQDKVFDALERGSRQATVEMYKIIAEAGANSPLMQLAQLKIGTALAEDGENDEAIKWLRGIEINDPKSSLLPEALPALSQALINEIKLREELMDWQAISDLYADNSSYIAESDLPTVQRVLARAYEKLGRFAEARQVWQELEEQTPEKRLARLKALVENSLKIGDLLKSVDYLVEMAKEFPKENEFVVKQLAQLAQTMNRPDDPEAANNLLYLAKAINFEPLRKNSLADAIEIEINAGRYDKASALMEQFRREYPNDELTPEYLLTQAQIEDYSKRYERAWDLLSDFRIQNPQDPRGPELLLGQIAKAEELERPDDAFRFMDLYQASFPATPEGRNMLPQRMNKEWNLGRQQAARDTLSTFRKAYPGDPALVGLIIRQSNREWEAGNYDQAREDIDDLILNFPHDPRTINFIVNRAEKEWEKERYDQAQELVQALLHFFSQSPQVGDLMLKLAGDDWNRGRFEAARQGWDNFRKTFPNDPRVGQSYLDQYRKAVAGGFKEEAAQVADKSRALLPPSDQALADLLLEQAKDYLAAGQVDEGLKKWAQFREQFPDDPRNPDLLLIQARQELKAGRNKEALAHLHQFLDQYPNSEQTPDVYLETAAAELAHGTKEAAWQLFDRYHTSFPTHPGRAQAILDQAGLGQAINRPAEAIALYKLFRQDYQGSPEAPKTVVPQAKLEVAAGQTKAAIATLEAGQASYSTLADDAQVSALLADLYLDDGQVEKWAATVESTLNNAPDPKADLPGRFLKYNQLAQVYVELGKPTDAERNFDAALANRPPDASPEAIYAIAGAYKKLLRPEKYAKTLALVRDSGDEFWKKIAEGELADLGSVGQQ